MELSLALVRLQEQKLIRTILEHLHLVGKNRTCSPGFKAFNRIYRNEPGAVLKLRRHLETKSFIVRKF